MHPSGRHRALVRAAIAVAVLATLAGCGERIGPLSRADSDLVRTHGALAFDSAAWQRTDASGRGAMLASLFRDRFEQPARNVEVFSVLGTADCYIGYEDAPCYRVQLGNEAYRLEFPVDHSDRPGAMLGVRLRPIAPGRTGVGSPTP